MSSREIPQSAFKPLTKETVYVNISFYLNSGVKNNNSTLIRFDKEEKEAQVAAYNSVLRVELVGDPSLSVCIVKGNIAQNQLTWVDPQVDFTYSYEQGSLGLMAFKFHGPTPTRGAQSFPGESLYVMVCDRAVYSNAVQGLDDAVSQASVNSSSLIWKVEGETGLPSHSQAKMYKINLVTSLILQPYQFVDIHTNIQVDLSCYQLKDTAHNSRQDFQRNEENHIIITRGKGPKNVSRLCGEIRSSDTDCRKVSLSFLRKRKESGHGSKKEIFEWLPNGVYYSTTGGS
jgi:hypothetical protein